MDERIIGTLLIAVTCLSLASVAPAIAQNWEVFHYDMANTGYTTSDAPDTNQTKWTTGNIGAVEGSQAMIVGDKVFVYADTQVHALDRDTGTIIWSASIPGDTSGFGSWASPAYDDGMLFVSCGYNLSRIDGADGSVEQMIAFPDGGHSCNGGPTVANGMVFAGSGYGNPTAHYYAFNASDLTDVLWSFDVGSDVAGSTPAVAGNSVVFGNGSSLTCVSKIAGSLIWTTDLSSGTILGSAAINSANDRVYVATGSGSLALLHALNFTDGSLIWTSYNAIDFTDGTPAILDIDHIYISGNAYGSPGSTYCFNSTGHLLWSVPCGSWVMSPAVADGKLYTGDCDDMGGWGFFEGICAYNATDGTLIWSYPYAGSSPSVSDGMVVSIGKNGKVYAFAQPDLAVTGKSEEWLSLEDMTYSITYTVKNTGKGPACASTTSISIDGEEKATDSVPELTAGESYTNTVGPFTMSENKDTINVCVDNDKVVDESDETNNCLENEWMAPPPPQEVPAITPFGFALAALSMFGLAAVAMRKMR